MKHTTLMFQCVFLDHFKSNQAPWNHFYYILLDGALPPTEDPFSATTGIKVVIDQFLQAPIFTVLIFFFLGTLEGKSVEDVKGQLDRDYKDTMLANWKLWLPATVGEYQLPNRVSTAHTIFSVV